MRAKIDAAYAESVKFAPEVDAFEEAIAAAVKVGKWVFFCTLLLCFLHLEAQETLGPCAVLMCVWGGVGGVMQLVKSRPRR